MANGAFEVLAANGMSGTELPSEIKFNLNFGGKIEKEINLPFCPGRI
jgi:hypothetical protein